MAWTMVSSFSLALKKPHLETPSGLHGLLLVASDEDALQR
jgi:hypothetical protein